MACGCEDGSRGSLENALAPHEGHQQGEPGQQELRWSGSSGSASTTGSSDWSEGWGTGGELVSLSDLQFSRIIGEVSPLPSANSQRQAALLAAERSCLARAYMCRAHLLCAQKSADLLAADVTGVVWPRVPGQVAGDHGGNQAPQSAPHAGAAQHRRTRNHWVKSAEGQVRPRLPCCLLTSLSWRHSRCYEALLAVKP